MNPMSSALKNKMKSPPTDDAHSLQSLDKAPELSGSPSPPAPPHVNVPHGTSPAGQQIPPELLQLLLQALAGHGGPLSQMAGKQHGKPVEGSPLEEAGESPMMEKKEDAGHPFGKKKSFGKF